jgi:alpha-mannosidase
VSNDDAAKSGIVDEALARLRRAADQLASAWPEMEWSGPALAKPLVLAAGEFRELVLEPGRVLELHSQIRAPRDLEGVDIVGDALDVMVDSIYPVELEYDGALVFGDAGSHVAPGPVLARTVPKLTPGDNGRLTLWVTAHSYRTWPWLRLRFSTPRLRAGFELLDVAWAQLALAAEVAASARERADVESAARLVIEANLVRPGDPELAGRLEEVAAALEGVGDRVQRLVVHVIGHSHIDMNWLWTWPDTVEVIKRDFATILALMDEFPEMTFTHSQPATYEVIREQAPALFSKVREHVVRGRWEVATMQWVESDLNMISGESLAHHLLEGVGYARENFGSSPSVFMAPDTFGHAGNVPQLARSAGARSYYHHRCNPGGHDLLPAYWWEGEDGSRVLALSTHSYNGLITAGGIAQAALRAYRHGLSTALLFHGVGDHGGGPTREGLEALRRFASLRGLPKAVCSTLAAHAEEVLSASDRIPVHRGELNTIFEACYTTHVDAKLRNRRAENRLTTAETLAALAGVDERERLSEGWRRVLFNQFHDILCGSSIHEAYGESARDVGLAEEAANAVIDEASRILETGADGADVVVTNPLGWDREEVVELPWDHARQGTVRLQSAAGSSVPGQWTSEGLAFLARVPAFDTVGYTLHADANVPSSIVIAEEELYIAVETQAFVARLHRSSGAIVSLRDKRVGRELVGYGTRRGSDYLDSARVDLALNVLQVLDERPHEMSAWHLDEVMSETSLLEGAVTEVVETGPVRAVISIDHPFRHSRLRQRIVFYDDVPRIDFETLIDWQEPAGPDRGIPGLKVAFNARLPEIEAWHETPYAAARRPSDGQEVPALRWADVGGAQYGIALLNDGRHGHDSLGSRLRLTLVRSAFDPDPMSDIGEHRLRYCLVPHPGDWRQAGVTRLAAGFNQQLIARAAPKNGDRTRRGWRPRQLGSPGVLLSALKMARHGPGVVLRLQESFGEPGEAVVDGLPPGWHAHTATITEDAIDELPVRSGRFRVPMLPWQVVTVVATEGL